MSNQIDNPPNVYDFGKDFNYAVWTPGTEVALVNVPWNNDYRDVVEFSNQNALNAYIDERSSSGIRINNLSYVKPNQGVRINIPINRALKYNYLRASNPLQPVPGGDEIRNYYYFINDVRYVAPNTTELVLQLDVFQTYGYDIQFGQCFVERGHLGVANENKFDAFGREYLTVPEGLDYGSEYQTIAKRSFDYMGLTRSGSTISFQNDVIVVSTTNFEGDHGTVDDPNMPVATGTMFENMVSGADIWVFGSVESFFSFMSAMQNVPWIMQGIISITIIPKLSRYHSDFDYGSANFVKADGYISSPKKHTMFTNWRASSEIRGNIPNRYRHVRDKFLCYPYTIVESTTYTGTPIILKPEMWNHADAPVMERATLTPPNQRLEFIPRYYNSKKNSGAENYGNFSEFSGMPEGWRETGDDDGEYLDLSTKVVNFPKLAVVNNQAINYMASNANAIAQGYRSASWDQQRALASAQNSYDIASGQIQTNQALTDIAIAADVAQTGNVNRTQAAQAIVSGIGSAVGGAGTGAALGARGGPAGAIAGAAVGAAGSSIGAITNGINTGIQIAANDEALAIRNTQANQSLGAQNRQQSLVRDSNNDLAQFAARGDYANAIAGISAKVQDAQMLQPSVAGQMGGEAMNFVNAAAEFSCRWKMIDQAAIRMIGEFWLRYGYAINTRYDLSQGLKVMTKFSYWKLRETYIKTSTVPEGFKQVIRGIFEKGVTVWSDPDDIGSIDWADNVPVAGVSY